MEFHVRSARLTDVENAIRILLRDAPDRDEERDDADRLRSLLFLPAATVVVAESERRLLGVGVLSMRPSVRSGPFVGVIDELGLAPVGTGRGSDPGDADEAGRNDIGHAIIDVLVSSARNKGCARVEVTDHLADTEPELLASAGFDRRGVLLSRAIG